MRSRTIVFTCYLFLAVGGLCLAGCSDDPGPDPGSGPDGIETAALPDEYVPRGDEFLVVYLPDTQVYADRFPETFDSQLRWIAGRAEEYSMRKPPPRRSWNARWTNG